MSAFVAFGSLSGSLSWVIFRGPFQVGGELSALRSDPPFLSLAANQARRQAGLCAGTWVPGSGSGLAPGVPVEPARVFSRGCLGDLRPVPIVSCTLGLSLD